MNREIGLPITIQIKRPQHQRSGHRLFKNTGGDRLAIVFHETGQTNVKRD